MKMGKRITYNSWDLEQKRKDYPLSKTLSWHQSFGVSTVFCANGWDSWVERDCFWYPLKHVGYSLFSHLLKFVLGIGIELDFGNVLWVSSRLSCFRNMVSQLILNCFELYCFHVAVSMFVNFPYVLTKVLLHVCICVKLYMKSWRNR